MTQAAMIDYKYHNRRYLTDFFIHAIRSIHLQEIKSWNLQAIVPIPIHKNKRKKRGYNQAELLAQQLAYHLNLPCYSNLIIRQIDTLPQKQFSPQARLSNLQKAFALNPRYQDEVRNLKRILLVDDIYTTGATMETCARILLDAGTDKVYIYSICIGVSRD